MGIGTREVLLDHLFRKENIKYSSLTLNIASFLASMKRSNFVVSNF